MEPDDTNASGVVISIQTAIEMTRIHSIQHRRGRERERERERER